MAKYWEAGGPAGVVAPERQVWDASENDAGFV